MGATAARYRSQRACPKSWSGCRARGCIMNASVPAVAPSLAQCQRPGPMGMVRTGHFPPHTPRKRAPNRSADPSSSLQPPNSSSGPLRDTLEHAPSPSGPQRSGRPRRRSPPRRRAAPSLGRRHHDQPPPSSPRPHEPRRPGARAASRSSPMSSPPYPTLTATNAAQSSTTREHTTRSVRVTQCSHQRFSKPTIRHVHMKANGDDPERSELPNTREPRYLRGRWSALS